MQAVALKRFLPRGIYLDGQSATTFHIDNGKNVGGTNKVSPLLVLSSNIHVNNDATLNIENTLYNDHRNSSHQRTSLQSDPSQVRTASLLPLQSKPVA
jgi:hypothetical protein